MKKTFRELVPGDPVWSIKDDNLVQLVILEKLKTDNPYKCCLEFTDRSVLSIPYQDSTEHDGYYTTREECIENSLAGLRRNLYRLQEKTVRLMEKQDRIRKVIGVLSRSVLIILLFTCCQEPREVTPEEASRCIESILGDSEEEEEFITLSGGRIHYFPELDIVAIKEPKVTLVYWEGSDVLQEVERTFSSVGISGYYVGRVGLEGLDSVTVLVTRGEGYQVTIRP